MRSSSASPSPAGNSRAGFRPDLEGLRGVAILAVVLFHAGVPGFGGGFVGVDVFFVLSGYLITGLLVREIDVEGRVDFLAFYGRRARRLLPAFAVVLLSTLLALKLLLSPLEQFRTAGAAQWAAAYLSNFWFLDRIPRYFAPEAAHNAFLHTWSLSVEEQFYLLWPALLLLATRGRGSRGRMATLLSMLALASFSLSIWQLSHSAGWAFFGLPARAWEFGLGGLASLPSAAVGRMRPYLVSSMGWAGLLVIAASTLLFSDSTKFPGYAALAPVLGSLAVLVAGAALPEGGPSGLLGHPWLRQVGRLSYSWYLWHWPVLVIATGVRPSITLSERLCCLLLSLALSLFSLRWIENPIRFSPALIHGRRRTLLLAATITAIALGTTYSVRAVAERALQTPWQRTILEASTHRPEHGENCADPVVDGGFRECTFGSPESPSTIALFGDSHAEQWIPAFKELARKNDWRLVGQRSLSCGGRARLQPEAAPDSP